MLFNTLHFISLPVGQVKLKNNLPEAISACLEQALISNPALTLYKNNAVPLVKFLHWAADCSNHWDVFFRGGVEDTRLEAKDTKESKAKNSLSEDRPCRGQEQERSRPRTKDTATSVLQKKGLQKSFSGDLQFIGIPRIFDWGRPKPQITCYDVIKNFQKRKFLWDKDIAEWKIWNRCLLALNPDFAKGEGLN